MGCPDTSRLIDFLLDPTSDQTIREHVESCPDCKAEYRILIELPGLFDSKGTVPEPLVQRVVQNLSAHERGWSCGPVPVMHAAVSGALGAVTMALAILFTGSAGNGGLVEFILFSLAIGIGVGAVQFCSGEEEGITDMPESAGGIW